MSHHESAQTWMFSRYKGVYDSTKKELCNPAIFFVGDIFAAQKLSSAQVNVYR
jgi:hypothetical protein